MDGGREGAVEGGKEEGGKIWIWRPMLRLTKRPGGSTIAFPTTLHISRPGHMKCTPEALDGPLLAPWPRGSAWATIHSARGVLPAPPRGPTPARAPGAPGHLDPVPTPAAAQGWI